MIRINLLPRRREAKRDGTRTWIVLTAAALVLQVIVLVIVHANKRKALEDQLERNRAVEASIAEKRGKVQNHESIKKQLVEYQAREDAIAKLQAGRTGPTSVLLELSRMLSPRRMPTTMPETLERLRHDSPASLPNEHWDPRRLSLTSFVESDRKVTVSGVGRSNEDVAEFFRRLSVSRYFTDVKLVKTEEKIDKDQATGVALPSTTFLVKAVVVY